MDYSAIRLAIGPSSRRCFAVSPADVTTGGPAISWVAAGRAGHRSGGRLATPEAAVDRANQGTGRTGAGSVNDQFDRSKMPKLGPTPCAYAPPRFERVRGRMGWSCVIVECHELPIVTST